MTEFDSNTFENDYILACLKYMVEDMKTDKPLAQIIDHYAVKITAFMNGQIRSAVNPSDGTRTVPTMHEDELPDDMTDAEYKQWFENSYVPDGVGCRVGPVFIRPDTT